MPYYYLLSSLSSPRLEQEAPISSPDFLSLCDRMASAEDRAVLSAVALMPPRDCSPETARGSALLREYWGREIALRNELTRLRAGKMGLRPEGYLRAEETMPNDGGAAQMARGAFQMEDPLQAELALDSGRWSWIDEGAVLRGFSSDALVAYLLKILILERRSRFKAEEGSARYDWLYREILGAASGIKGISRMETNDGLS